MNRRLTPPPRVEPRVAAARRVRSGGIGWRTIAAFLVLGALTVSVFAFLPGWVTPSARAPEPEPEVEADAEAEAAAAPIVQPSTAAVSVTVNEPEPRPESPNPSPVATPPPPSPPPKPAPLDPTEAEFTRAMSEGMTALNGQDYEEAKAAFERARSLRPGSAEALDALAQADERLRLDAIAGHRERGAELESREEWRKAEAEYDQALALEPTLLFAREGKSRTGERAEIAEALAFHISSPERLSDDAVLREATRVLRRGEAVAAPPGPRHADQLKKLQSLIDAYSRVVVAEIRSDGLTEITVYRVGRLGSFQSRSLELRPGRYTVIGSRDGYRDVRRDLLIEPGKTPAPLVVRCEEPLR